MIEREPNIKDYELSEERIEILGKINNRETYSVCISFILSSIIYISVVTLLAYIIKNTPSLYDIIELLIISFFPVGLFLWTVLIVKLGDLLENHVEKKITTLLIKRNKLSPQQYQKDNDNLKKYQLALTAFQVKKKEKELKKEEQELNDLIYKINQLYETAKYNRNLQSLIQIRVSMEAKIAQLDNAYRNAKPQNTSSFKLKYTNANAEYQTVFNKIDKYRNLESGSRPNILSPISEGDQVNNTSTISKENLIAPDKALSINFNRKSLPKLNYLEIHKSNEALGLQGEKFVIEFEKQNLNTQPGNLQEQIIHVSQEIGDHMGYDILSYDNTGNPIFIEVKTTKGEFDNDFYISENELNCFRNNKNYIIYRVYNFTPENNMGKIQKIKSIDEIQQTFDIKPISYKITPKK